MEPVTCWYRLDLMTQNWEHNHYEDGHVNADRPIPQGDHQQVWRKMAWLKRWKYMTEDKRIIESITQ